MWFYSDNNSNNNKQPEINSPIVERAKQTVDNLLAQVPAAFRPMVLSTLGLEWGAVTEEGIINVLDSIQNDIDYIRNGVVGNEQPIETT